MRLSRYNGICVSVAIYSKGIGAEVEHIADYKGRRGQMWEMGILGDLTPQALVRSVFFEWEKVLPQGIEAFTVCRK